MPSVPHGASHPHAGVGITRGCRVLVCGPHRSTHDGTRRDTPLTSLELGLTGTEAPTDLIVGCIPLCFEQRSRRQILLFGSTGGQDLSQGSAPQSGSRQVLFPSLSTPEAPPGLLWVRRGEIQIPCVPLKSKQRAGEQSRQNKLSSLFLNLAFTSTRAACRSQISSTF